MTNDDKAQMWAYYWHMIAGDAAPRPRPEVEFDKHIGRRHRFDWAYPDYKIAVEVDGGQWAKHGGRHSTDADRDKLNIAASLGWRVFRFSPQQLRANPENCVELVLCAMQDRK